MRDVKVIEAEIAKLQAELEDAKDFERMCTSAVRTLNALGWVYTRRGGWKKAPSKVIDPRNMPYVKGGDWAK